MISVHLGTIEHVPKPAADTTPSRDEKAWAAAVAFEAGFLAEMLKSSGLNAADGAFSGGPGEEAFSSLLTREYADKLAKSGGLGLAEHVYHALVQSGNNT